MSQISSSAYKAFFARILVSEGLLLHLPNAMRRAQHLFDVSPRSSELRVRLHRLASPHVPRMQVDCPRGELEEQQGRPRAVVGRQECDPRSARLCRVSDLVRLDQFALDAQAVDKEPRSHRRAVYQPGPAELVRQPIIVVSCDVEVS